MKNLQGAFPETPEYVSSAIRAGVRKALRRDRWRKRIYAAAAIAAVFAVLIGALSLSLQSRLSPGNRGLRGPLSHGALPSATPTPDPTPMPTPFASLMVTLEPPEPALTSTPAPTVSVEPASEQAWSDAAQSVVTIEAGEAMPTATEATEEEYFSTRGGQYYHVDSACSGMVGASLRPLWECEKLAQSACPVCLRDAQTRFYSNIGGTYYHIDARCSGMIGALARTRGEVQMLGQRPCQTCIGSELQILDAQWDGEYLLVSYEMNTEGSLFVTANLGKMNPPGQRAGNVGDAKAQFRSVLTDDEAESVLIKIEDGVPLYLERTRAELLPENGDAPVARRVLNEGDIQRIYAMYAVGSYEEMHFRAETGGYMFYLDADGTFYTDVAAQTECAFDWDSERGSFRLRHGGANAHIDISPMVGAWEVLKEGGISYDANAANLKFMGGAFDGMVLLEMDVSADTAGRFSLEIDGVDIPLMYETDGKVLHVRALLRVEEAERMFDDPGLLQMGGADWGWS